MAETIARIGKEVTRPLRRRDGVGVELRAQAAHAVSVERHADARVLAAGPAQYLRSRCRLTIVKIKQHDIETSLLEGMLTRGDRRVGAGAGRSLAARLPARRLDASASSPRSGGRPSPTSASTPTWYSQRTRPMTEVLPWDHVNVKKGREYLEKEQNRSLMQLQVMADAK